jgi:hypothetical protein
MPQFPQTIFLHNDAFQLHPCHPLTPHDHFPTRDRQPSCHHLSKANHSSSRPWPLLIQEVVEHLYLVVLLPYRHQHQHQHRYSTSIRRFVCLSLHPHGTDTQPRLQTFPIRNGESLLLHPRIPDNFPSFKCSINIISLLNQYHHQERFIHIPWAQVISLCKPTSLLLADLLPKSGS